MTQIFVGNLSFNTRESDLRSAFERYGRVSSVRIVTEPSSNRSRGFGFVRMPSLDDADDAIKRMSGMSLNGRQLTVNEAEHSPGSSSERSDKPNRPGADPTARRAAMAMFESLLDDSSSTAEST